ncbi:MAG: hypothetical protein J7M05_08145, partial [Anaerolineae bacterium]|nr:hypothetical protein [Anaerolineae bacterium]
AYLSRDGGAHWEGPWLSDQVVHAVLFSPQYPNDSTLFLGADEGLYTSHDDGQHWQRHSSLQDTVNALVACGTALYAGTDHQGVYFSNDGGDTWTQRNQGIANLPMYAVAASPEYLLNRTILAGGPSGVWRSADDGQHWTHTELDYATVNALAYSSSTLKAFAATDGGVFISSDGGRHWQATPSSPGMWNVLDLALGPNDELWIATQGGGIYFSTDGGATWEERSSGLTNTHVTSLVWLKREGQKDYLLAGTWGGGTFISQNGGQTWSPSQDGPETPHIYDLASAVGYGMRIWTFASTTAGVFRSGNLGETWDFAGLLGMGVSSIALHPEYATRPNCYVGSLHDGLFRSLNGGLTWQPLNEGLGNLSIHDVVVVLDEEEQPVILAATQGGIWRYGRTPYTPTPKTWRLSLPLLAKGSTLGQAIHTNRPPAHQGARPQRANR